MKKQKQPDRLSQEVSLALAAGMSYGKWKAMQNATRIEKKSDIPDGWLVCQWCGKAFKPKTRRPQKFFQTYCQREAYKETYRAKNTKYMREYRRSRQS